MPKDIQNATVAPRFNPKMGGESATAVITMGEVLRKDVKRMGTPTYLDEIMTNLEGVPTFQIDEHDNIISGQEVVAQREQEQTPIVTKEDCTAGCGQRGTVTPLDKHLRNWECSACGKQYKMQ